MDSLCFQYVLQNFPWRQAEASQTETMKGELDLAVGMVEGSYLWAMQRFLTGALGPASHWEIIIAFLIKAALAPESRMLYVGRPGQAAQPLTFIIFTSEFLHSNLDWSRVQSSSCQFTAMFQHRT